MGFWARGVPNVAPLEYTVQESNLQFEEGGVKTRGPFQVELAPGSGWDGTVRRIIRAEIYGAGDINFILDTSGNIWGVRQVPPATFLVEAAGSSPAQDFTGLGINGKFYYNTLNPPGELKVFYLSTSTLAPVTANAGGAAPIFTIGIVGPTLKTTAPYIETGYRAVAVAYRTGTGHITAPGLSGSSWGVMYVPPISAGGPNPGASFQINLPPPPAGSDYKSRVVLVTKMYPAPLSNPLDYEWFFLPGGEYPWTFPFPSTATIAYFDNDLVEEANFLVDALSTIPGGFNLNVYDDRLAIAINNGGSFSGRGLLLSAKDDLESFVPDNAFISLQEYVYNTIVQRGVLFSLTFSKTFVTSANGDEPSTWDTQMLDAAYGSVPHGVGQIYDTTGQNIEQVLVVNPGGLFAFSGTYANQIPLSYVIDDFWKRINFEQIYKIQIIVDPIKNKFYILVPPDTSTENYYIIHGDYSEGLSWDKVKFSIWSFPRSIGGTTPVIFGAGIVSFNKTTGRTDLLIGLAVGGPGQAGLLKLGLGTSGDAGGIPIISHYMFGGIIPDKVTGVALFNSLRFHGSGIGKLEFNLYSGLIVSPVAIPSITFNAGQNQYTRKFQFLAEKLYLQLGINIGNEVSVSEGDRFRLDGIDIDAKPFYEGNLND